MPCSIEVVGVQRHQPHPAGGVIEAARRSSTRPDGEDPAEHGVGDATISEPDLAGTNGPYR
jgi:hypothetical protein